MATAGRVVFVDEPRVFLDKLGEPGEIAVAQKIVRINVKSFPLDGAEARAKRLKLDLADGIAQYVEPGEGGEIGKNGTRQTVDFVVA